MTHTPTLIPRTCDNTLYVNIIVLRQHRLESLVLGVLLGMFVGLWCLCKYRSFQYGQKSWSKWCFCSDDLMSKKHSENYWGCIRNLSPFL